MLDGWHDGIYIYMGANRLKNRTLGAIKNWRKSDLKFCNFYPVHSSQANDGGVDFRALRCQDCAINLEDPSSVYER